MKILRTTFAKHRFLPDIFLLDLQMKQHVLLDHHNPFGLIHRDNEPYH